MRLTILFLSLVLAPLHALCYNYESITVDHGLANMIVRSSAQDKNRVLWFATNSGIQSFDGGSFTDYHVRNMTGCQSNDNRFVQVLTDSRGELYGVNKGNLFRYNRDMDSFEAIFSVVDTPQREGLINRVDILSGDAIYISTSKGLYVLSAAGDSPRLITDKPSLGAVERGDGIYIATNAGLMLFHAKSTRATQHTFVVNFIHADSRDNIWIQQKGKGTLILTKNNTQIVPQWSTLLQNKPIRSIAEYEGQYVVAVDGIGLLFCDADFSLVSIDKPIEGFSGSLTTDGIYDLFKDADNYLWIATFMGGLNYVNPNALGFQHIQHQENQPNTLSNNNVRAVMEHSNSELWFGNKKGVSVLNVKDKRWRHKMDLPSNTVLALREDRNQHVWVSAFSAGIIIFDKELRRVRTINVDNSKITSNDIFVIFRDADDDMWLSGEDGSVCRIDIATMEVTRYPINNIVREIKQLGSGEIALVGSNGVHLIDKKSSTFNQIYPKAGTSSRVSMLYSIVEQGSGELWLASEGDGMLRISSEGELLQSLTMEDGLLSNVIYGLERSGDNLWISTGKGLSRYNLLTHTLINFTKDSGIGISGFIYCCHTSLRNGKLMFGGLGGTVLFDPNDIYYPNELRPLIFTKIKVFDKELRPARGAPIDRAINESRRVRLRYNQNSISLSFVSVMPVNSVYNEYEWMLEGVDTKWSKPSSSNTATYNNLSAGRYKFKVRTVSYGRSTPVSQQELEVIITPPWWYTYWAYSAYFIIVMTIVLLTGVYIRNMIASKINANKVKLFTGIAHDIKTPLSIIKLLLSNISSRVNDDESVQDISLAMKQSDHLTELANQLLELEKVSSGNEALPSKVAKYRIEASIEGISYAFSSPIEHKKIVLEFRFPQTPTWAWFDMNMFQKVIYNLLDNAVKYTPQGGRISVSTHIASKWCFITISDTGIGIPENAKGNILHNYFRASNAVNSSEAGSGVGLMLVKSLVRNMSGKITFDTKEGSGTTFTIQLPLGRGHIKRSDEVMDSHVKPIQSPIGRYNILLVEDNIELRETVCQKLETIYNVTTAGDGIEAMACVESSVPDLIITDYMMPNMNGLELCRKLKSEQRFCRIPVIMLTALSSNEHKVEGFNVGVDSYIEKPFDINVILSRIENLIYNRALLSNGDSLAVQSEQSLPESAESRLLQLFESHVVEHLSDCDFSVEDICRQMGIGYTSFYRKLKSITGKTPIDIITEIRLRKSNEYLATGDYTISQIGYMTGFSSPSYFAKVYKKHFGHTPMEYPKPK